MVRNNFSPNFRRFGDWLKASDRTTKYAKEIIAKHAMFPDRTLASLQKLKMSDIDISAKGWNSLSEGEAYERTKALQAAKIMRYERHDRETGKIRKYSMKEALKEVNQNIYEENRLLTPQKMKKHLGKSLYKEGKRWKIAKEDKIEVRLTIYSNGKTEYVTTRSNKAREVVRLYHEDVRKAVRAKTVKEREEILKNWKGKYIRDKTGKKWMLETTIEGIENAKEGETTGYQTIYAK